MGLSTLVWVQDMQPFPRTALGMKKWGGRVFSTGAGGLGFKDLRQELSLRLQSLQGLGLAAFK